MARLLPALWIAAALAGCSGRPDSTPLPTQQTTIDPVLKKLDAAEQMEQKRREQMEDAAK